jgi:hypothetical protein
MDNPIIRFLVSRLREPSSWAGLSVLLVLVGFSSEEAEAVNSLLAAVVATASVFIGERS